MQKCSKEGCNAPKAYCQEFVTNEYQKCPHWIGGNNVKDSEDGDNQDNSNKIPWTGIAMYPDDISLLSSRSTPLIIGMVGSANAGKTSYLGMLYTLLFNGKTFQNWNFSGSYTLIAWENLAKYLKIKPNGKADYAPPTPSNPEFYSLYHLALKKEDQLYDVLYADSSGEVFTDWAIDVNDHNAENARWIYKNSNAFIFFIDCEKIIETKGVGVQKIRQLSGQIASQLKNRPVLIVWSKADRIDEVPINLKKAIEQTLKRDLPKSIYIEISNFSKKDPDKICHVNNLEVTEQLLNELSKPKRLTIKPNIGDTTDYFFKYQGSYGNK